MAGEYQFSLIDVTKQAGTKTILQDVNLSFFYGAHIGVIGGNGAGKSTLLKILAGIDTELMGTVQVAKGTKVGYLPQEPELDDSKTVAEVVAEGVAHDAGSQTSHECIFVAHCGRGHRHERGRVDERHRRNHHRVGIDAH